MLHFAGDFRGGALTGLGDEALIVGLFGGEDGQSRL